MAKKQPMSKKRKKTMIFLKCDFCNSYFIPDNIKIEERVKNVFAGEDYKYDQTTKIAKEINYWRIEKQIVKIIKCPICENENEIVSKREVLSSYNTERTYR